jgi:hypothetical protein
MILSEKVYSQPVNATVQHYAVEVLIQLARRILHQKLNLPHKLRILIATFDLTSQILAATSSSLPAHNNASFSQIYWVNFEYLHADSKPVVLFLQRRQAVIIQEKVLQLVKPIFVYLPIRSYFRHHLRSHQNRVGIFFVESSVGVSHAHLCRHLLEDQRLARKF